MQTQLFIFRLDPVLKDALAACAHQTGRSMSDLVREALREKVSVQ